MFDTQPTTAQALEVALFNADALIKRTTTEPEFLHIRALETAAMLAILFPDDRNSIAQNRTPKSLMDELKQAALSTYSSSDAPRDPVMAEFIQAIGENLDNLKIVISGISKRDEYLHEQLFENRTQDEITVAPSYVALLIGMSARDYCATWSTVSEEDALQRPAHVINNEWLSGEFSKLPIVFFNRDRAEQIRTLSLPSILRHEEFHGLSDLLGMSDRIPWWHLEQPFDVPAPIEIHQRCAEQLGQQLYTAAQVEVVAYASEGLFSLQPYSLHGGFYNSNLEMHMNRALHELETDDERLSVAEVYRREYAQFYLACRDYQCAARELMESTNDKNYSLSLLLHAYVHDSPVLATPHGGDPLYFHNKSKEYAHDLSQKLYNLNSGLQQPSTSDELWQTLKELGAYYSLESLNTLLNVMEKSNDAQNVTEAASCLFTVCGIYLHDIGPAPLRIALKHIESRIADESLDSLWKDTKLTLEYIQSVMTEVYIPFAELMEKAVQRDPSNLRE